MRGKILYTDRSGNIITKPSPKHKTQDNEPLLRPYATPHLSKNAVSVIPPQYFSGMQLKDIYNIPTISPLNPSTRKTIIAIVIAYTYPKLKADLESFWKNPINFGPSSTPPDIKVYTMPGATQHSGWAQEECLDVQMVCTINPNADIWVVEAKSDRTTDLLAAVYYATNTVKADVLSMSWGGSESKSFLSYNSHFNNPAVCYCASSGDSNTVSWPATNPNCIAVGGTTLIWNPNLTPNRTESAWDLAGCGYSFIYDQPAYQSGVITNKYRSIPDLALIADSNTSVYTVYNNNWYGVGGTSVAAPILAGMVSLANQQRLNAGKSVLTTVKTTSVPPANHLQTYLYKTIYPNLPLYNSVFYDVTSGKNKLGSASGSATKMTTYNTGAKFDIPTGLGSPNALHLCNALINM